MPYVRVWIHAVWATKDRQPFLDKSIRSKLFSHIVENAQSKGIFLDRINGYLEHAHALISLGNNQTISKTLQLLKGESSFWINNNGLIKGKFEWQDEYFAASVDESQLDKIRHYIDHQEDHHNKGDFCTGIQRVDFEVQFRKALNARLPLY